MGRPEFAGYGLAALVVVGATVLLAMGKQVPAEYWLLAGVGAGGGAGVSVHRPVTNQPVVDTPSGPAVPTTAVPPWPVPTPPAPTPPSPQPIPPVPPAQ